MRRLYGQNAVEFAIIIALLVIVGVVSLKLLGNNIFEMFDRSNEEVKTYKPFDFPVASSSPVETTGVLNSTQEESNDELEIASETNTSTNANTTIAGTPVTIQSDGSAAFKIDQTNITMSPAMIDKLNVVFETTGSSGLSTEVMQAIQKLVADHKDEYPDGDVPINMAFGTGTRFEGTESSTGFTGGHFTGSASVNIVSLSIGSHTIIIQKDQTDTANLDTKAVSSLEVNLDGTGVISSERSTIDGLAFNSATYDENGLPNYVSIPSSGTSGGGSWEFDFSNSSIQSI
jgi:Flp pilus assembly pilin Flp